MKRTALVAAVNRVLASPLAYSRALEMVRTTVCGPGLVFAAADGGNKPYIAPVMALRALNAQGSQYELMIYGDIGESWYGSSVLAVDVVAQLNELPPTVTQINVRINSYGGSVSDGLAIYNALNRMAATKVVTVDGVAMSIASLIAMAGDTIEMPETSLLMIHAPWGGCVGNSADMREFADFLDVYANAMAGAYMAKSGKSRDEVMQLLTDGTDHTYTGAQAKAEGFCDTLIALVDDETNEAGEGTAIEETADEDETVAFLAGMQRFTAQMPNSMSAINAALKHSRITASAAGARVAARPAASAASTSGDSDMLRKIKGRLVSFAPNNPHADLADGGAGGSAPSAAAAAPAPAPAAASVNAAAVAAAALAEIRNRNVLIEAALKPHMANRQISELYTSALADPAMSMDQVNAKAMAILAAHASPNQNDPVRIEAGLDQRDKTRARAVDFLIVRAGARGMKPEQIAAARQDNPFNGMTLLDMARDACARAGLNPTGWSKDRIVAAAITQSTSDFPNIFENVLHKLLINRYNSVEQTWRTFCRIGTLSDFRAHNRYYMGGFSDLQPVDQNGEYQDGTFSDAEKETITGKTKGRILNLSREMIINDDMGVFTTAAEALGLAAGRTLEKDVYALFALNGGAGPTLVDGNPLFHTSHANISGTPATVGTNSFDDMRVGMGSQMDPSGNDFLSITPALWLGPLKYKGDADIVNGSRYNVDVTNKFEIPNKSYGLVSSVVGTPRLTGTAWYGFANPDVEPVFEVGFLDGVQEPQIASEESFRSNGIAWRVIFDYGVAAVGFRGAWKNAGA